MNGTADQEQLIKLLERLEQLLRPQPEQAEVTDKQRRALFFGEPEQVEERLVLLSPMKWEWLLAWCTQYPSLLKVSPRRENSPFSTLISPLPIVLLTSLSPTACLPARA